MTLQPKHELRNFEEEEEKQVKKIKTFDILDFSDESSDDAMSLKNNYKKLTKHKMKTVK